MRCRYSTRVIDHIDCLQLLHQRVLAGSLWHYSSRTDRHIPLPNRPERQNANTSLAPPHLKDTAHTPPLPLSRPIGVNAMEVFSPDKPP